MEETPGQEELRGSFGHVDRVPVKVPVLKGLKHPEKVPVFQKQQSPMDSVVYSSKPLQPKGFLVLQSPQTAHKSVSNTWHQ